MIYVSVAVAIFLLELVIKNYVERHGKQTEEKAVLKGSILLRKYHNEGAFLNHGARMRPLVAGVSLVLTVLILLLFIITLGHRGNRLLKTGLALLLGGAFSNTYDRLRRKYVVDYFSFGVKWKRLRGIVFNIADFCIMTGTLMTVLFSETR